MDTEKFNNARIRPRTLERKRPPDQNQSRGRKMEYQQKSLETRYDQYPEPGIERQDCGALTIYNYKHSLFANVDALFINLDAK